nr:MAG: hypothetical protein DIU78_15205 [Pseudomonadota bacterium]
MVRRTLRTFDDRVVRALERALVQDRKRSSRLRGIVLQRESDRSLLALQVREASRIEVAETSSIGDRSAAPSEARTVPSTAPAIAETTLEKVRAGRVGRAAATATTALGSVEVEGARQANDRG